MIYRKIGCFIYLIFFFPSRYGGMDCVPSRRVSEHVNGYSILNFRVVFELLRIVLSGSVHVRDIKEVGFNVICTPLLINESNFTIHTHTHTHTHTQRNFITSKTNPSDIDCMLQFTVSQFIISSFLQSSF